ncbi:MAG: hypothetical protein WAW06_04355 [bacterium]
MREDRMKILRMIEEGKISADEAAERLDALPCDRPAPEAARETRKIRVRITDPKTGKQTVNLTLPVGLAKFVARFIPAKTKKDLADEGVEIDSVLSQVMSENTGKIVDVESDEGNVQISIE